MNKLTQIKEQLEFMIQFMDKSSTHNSPACFNTPCCYIDYLVKLYNGSDKKAYGYKKFIKEIMSKINPSYRDFTYISGHQDLSIQIYHILRCGVIHSMSLYPDDSSLKKEGRKQSIVLGHRRFDGNTHLQNFSNGTIEDACIFIIEDFIADLKEVTQLIFKEAKINEELKNNIKSWHDKYPFIQAV